MKRSARRRRPDPPSPVSLLTNEDFATLCANARSRREDHVPVAKLFLGNRRWLLSECRSEPPWLAFALSDLGFGCAELGDVDLCELDQIFPVAVRIVARQGNEGCVVTTGRAPMRIERDDAFRPRWPLSVYADAARAEGRIVENGPAFDEAVQRFARREPERHAALDRDPPPARPHAASPRPRTLRPEPTGHRPTHRPPERPHAEHADPHRA